MGAGAGALTSGARHPLAAARRLARPELRQGRGWHLDACPKSAAMEATIHGVLNTVHVDYAASTASASKAFYPGPTYAYPRPPTMSPSTSTSETRPPICRWRVTTTALKLCGAPSKSSCVSSTPTARSQPPSGPDYKVDKSHGCLRRETSTIVDAAEAFDAMPDPAWLTHPYAGSHSSSA